MVQWLKYCSCDQHGLGSIPTCSILLCSWERHFAALSPAWWSWQAVINFNYISIKLLADSNILASPEAGWGNCLLYVLVHLSLMSQEDKYTDLLLLLSASPYSGSPQRDSNLHFTRSTSSPSLAPTLSMSSLTKSIHLLLGLPLFLLPGTAISIILFPM